MPAVDLRSGSRQAVKTLKPTGPCEVVRHFDVAVVGCGAAGASISHHLASRGAKTLTLEQFQLNHSNGSSHGRTRIIRTAYYEDPRYVPLLRSAFDGWYELQRVSGRRIIQLTGGLMIGAMDSELVKGVLRSAKEHGLEHDVLSSSEAIDRFGMFRLDEGQSAVYEKNAGVLFAEECLSAFSEAASRDGAEIRFGEALTGWKGTREGVEVRTAGETFLADRLALAAGPWNAVLLGQFLPLTCERQVQFWFRSKSAASGPDRMPVFISDEGGRLFYGIPDFGDGVKAAETHRGRRADPRKQERDVTQADREPPEWFVKRRLPDLEPEPRDSATCIYTNTPDRNFVIDFLPGDDRVLMVSACSGHGFKFASVIGEIAADLLLDGRTRHDISFLRAARFGPRVAF